MGLARFFLGWTGLIARIGAPIQAADLAGLRRT
jgi:hypothetical protein